MINNKIYIGQTTKADPTYFGSGFIILRAFKKYGKENFFREILEYCSNKIEMNEREKYWIKYFNSTNQTIGYNISTGGNGGNLGPEVNKKISEKVFRQYGNQHRKGLVPYNKGIPMTEEQKEKLRKPKSEAHKKAMKISKANNPVGCKPILCLNNNIIYKSSAEAAKILDVKASNITEVLKGRAKATKGYKFIYYKPE